MFESQRGVIREKGLPLNFETAMLRAWSERPLKMNPDVKTGLTSGTIKTPTAALLAMGSKLLRSQVPVSSTRLPPFVVACEEFQRQSEVLGARAGWSMPMRPADPSAKDTEVRPAFSPSRPRLRPCAWSSQLLAAIGFDPQKLEKLAFIGHYPSPNADPMTQLKDFTKPKVDPSLASMAVPSVVAGEVAKLAIRARTGSVLGARLGNSTLLPGGGILNGHLAYTMPPFSDTTMSTDAKLGADNVVPQPFSAAGRVLAGSVSSVCSAPSAGLGSASSVAALVCTRCAERLPVPPGAPGCRPAAAARARGLPPPVPVERRRPLLAAQNTDPASVKASRACLRSLIQTSSLSCAIVYGGGNFWRLERELRAAWRSGLVVAVEAVEAEQYRQLTGAILETTTGLVSPVDCAGSHGKIFIVQMQDGHVMICLQLEALL